MITRSPARILLCLALLLTCSAMPLTCASGKKMGSSVPSDLDRAIWSKSGRGLFYWDRELYRYDTLLKTVRAYRLPKPSNDGRHIHDISCDEKSALFDKLVGERYSIGIQDLATRSARIVYTASDPIRRAFWLSATTIAFGTENTFTILDIKTGVAKNIKDATLIIGSVDGSGLVYTRADKDGYHNAYYYDLATSQSKLLKGIKGVNEHTILYLSKRMLVYGGGKSAWAVDLNTLAVQTVAWPEFGYTVSMSPSLTMYWVVHAPRGEWQAPSFKLLPVPPAAVAVFRKIQGK